MNDYHVFANYVAFLVSIFRITTQGNLCTKSVDLAQIESGRGMDLLGMEYSLLSLGARS